MSLQDLTPQLRTRLSRLERWVGLFVLLAAVLTLVGLGYYISVRAQRKGWFVAKAPFFTYLHTGAGIKVGDPIKLMGFDAGEITRITPEQPDQPYDVYVEFDVRAPNIGYIWDDSVVRVKSAGLLGSRYLELTKGGTIRTNNLSATYKQDKNGKVSQMFLEKLGRYTNFTRGAPGMVYYLLADEPPDLSSQMDSVVQAAKSALPNILALTNQLIRVLNNTAEATERLNSLLMGAHPLLTNLTQISTQLTNGPGAFGDWLLPPALHSQLTQTLASAQMALQDADITMRSADTAITNTDARLALIASEVGISLENLANITGDLRKQVAFNTNILSEISVLIVHTDEMVQGMKRHWLLRSAFRTNAAPRTSTGIGSPKFGKGAERLRP